MSDFSKPVTDAEAAIAARKAVREANQIEFRSVQALEALADDVTRLRAEMTVIRYLLAGMAARPQ
ncbi:hypothetical protein [Bradyrhizobium pachyrhizi]|uniref:hypothetical protein n=1 Tax=Bradyrhizobium pachyrhizi TaxID=280333 RepID=UPI000B0E402E|nr:hypothetical protein [Bradyrhizobium pachyrhizi]